MAISAVIDVLGVLEKGRKKTPTLVRFVGAVLVRLPEAVASQRRTARGVSASAGIRRGKDWKEGRASKPHLQ